MKSSFWGIVAIAFIGIVTMALFAATVFRSEIEGGDKNRGSAALNGAAKITAPTVTIADPIRGPKTAAVTIVEFGDFACPFCKEAESVIKTILQTFPNDARLVWKDFPIKNLHPEAERAAMAARCAGEQGKFWEYHDLLFANQDKLRSEIYPQLAKAAGLDEKVFSDCLSSQKTKPLVDKGFEEGLALGIDGVPFVFINGIKYSGEVTVESLKAEIQKLLTKP